MPHLTISWWKYAATVKAKGRGPMDQPDKTKKNRANKLPQGPIVAGRAEEPAEFVWFVVHAGHERPAILHSVRLPCEYDAFLKPQP